MIDLRRTILTAVWAAALGLPGVLGANTTTNAPDFKEVYDLLRTHLAGATDADLNQAAVEGLLKVLDPQVTLVDERAPAGTSSNAAPAVASSVFEGAYGYVRLSQVDGTAGKKFGETFQQLAASNRIKGLVIDLRFADGRDYAAAAAVADRFLTEEQPLIDWGEGVKKSTAKTNAIGLPVAVLVNRKTSGAAEALAGMLRQTETALVIGSPTAGKANIAQEFTLKSGQRLRIATTPVKVGDGQALPLRGLPPDIAVTVSPEDELVYLRDAFKVLPKPARLAGGVSTNEVAAAGTNRVTRRRINEAELVRMQRDGQSLEWETNLLARDAEPARAVVQDPALARALDLLKGLALVHQFRSL